MLQLIASSTPSLLNEAFQTPSAGKWVLQLQLRSRGLAGRRWFQTPSAGKWVLQPEHFNALVTHLAMFQTPSAGRWLLQLPGILDA